MNNSALQSRSDHADIFTLKLVLFHWFLVSTITGFLFDAYLLGFVGGGLLKGRKTIDMS